MNHSKNFEGRLQCRERRFFMGDNAM